MIISLPRPIDSLIVSRYMYNFSLLSMLMKTIKINKQDDDYDNYDVFNVPLHFIIMSPPLRRILELFDKSTVLIITCSLALKLNWLSLSWLPDAERCVATFWATWYRHSLSQVIFIIFQRIWSFNSFASTCWPLDYASQECFDLWQFLNDCQESNEIWAQRKFPSYLFIPCRKNDTK